MKSGICWLWLYCRRSTSGFASFCVFFFLWLSRNERRVVHQTRQVSVFDLNSPVIFKLDASRAKEVLRGLSNCNINKGDDKKQMLMDCMISFTFSYGLVAHSLQQCIFTTIKR
uniref:Uncharacterized protein n=1 Tax=Opuntia streptacantha TaxID=393608 RepID=A0A7C9CZG8_OPUST